MGGQDHAPGSRAGHQVGEGPRDPGGRAGWTLDAAPPAHGSLRLAQQCPLQAACAPNSQVATTTRAVHGGLGTWGSGELRPEGHTGAWDPGPAAGTRKGMPVLTRTAPQVCLLPGGHPLQPRDTPPHSPEDIPHAAPETPHAAQGTHPTPPGRPPTPPHPTPGSPQTSPAKLGGPCSGPAQAMAPAAPHQFLSPRGLGAAGPSPLGPPTPDTGMRALCPRQPRAERELWVARLGHTGTDRGFFPRASSVEGWPAPGRARGPLPGSPHLLGL